MNWTPCHIVTTDFCFKSCKLSQILADMKALFSFMWKLAKSLQFHDKKKWREHFLLTSADVNETLIALEIVLHFGLIAPPIAWTNISCPGIWKIGQCTAETFLNYAKQGLCWASDHRFILQPQICRLACTFFSFVPASPQPNSQPLSKLLD